ncbi:TRAP transporter permease [Ornithinimicrobium sp. Y1847]|uniref:TRAP transporter permease n=1 Tax=Ornithinimicrobium sp. Y1847 TaxID=3405419 RepID=UPI003B67B86A
MACVAFSLFYIYTAIAGIVSQESHRAVFWGMATALAFVVFPMHKGEKHMTRPPWYDMVLVSVTLAAMAYFIYNYGVFANRTAQLTTAELALGLGAIVVSLEATRRALGWTLAVIALLAIAYILFGPHFPATFAHRGYSLERFVTSMYASFNGIFGIVTHVFATFVFLFILFGAILVRSGASQFLVDLPLAVAGRYRGGPAKVSVLASAVMASVSGSAVANVMTTGHITIPLMKKNGYRKEFAGGVEAAASTGGVIMPPVMGAGAFLVAQFTQTSYTTVVLVAIVPAIMYFWGVYCLVDIESLKRDLQAIPKEKLPSAGKVLKEGWFHFIPLIVIFSLILMRFSPAYAAFWGIISAIVIGFIPYQGQRLTIAKLFTGLRDGVLGALSVLVVVGSVGIVIGVVNLTGVALRLSDMVVALASGNLLIALVLVTLISWVLGLGLGVTVSYIVVAIVAAPALIEMGLTPLVAHLIIFWVAQDANLTPPIALAGFAGASIAGGRPMRTAYEGWMLGRGLYIVPLLMAYSPLVDGPFWDAVPVAVMGFFGIYVACLGLGGWWMGTLPFWLRGVFLVIGGLIIAPGFGSDAVGVAIFLVLFLWRRTRARG